MNLVPKTTKSSNDEIEQIAHSIWEQEGRPDGRSLEHWLRAEEQLRSRNQVQNSIDRNEQSSVIAPTEQVIRETARGSKGEVGAKRQPAVPLAPPNRIGRAALAF